MKSQKHVQDFQGQVASVAAEFDPTTTKSIEAMTMLGHEIGEMLDYVTHNPKGDGETVESFDARISDSWASIRAGYKHAHETRDRSKPATIPRKHFPAG